MATSKIDKNKSSKAKKSKSPSNSNFFLDNKFILSITAFLLLILLIVLICFAVKIGIINNDL